MINNIMAIEMNLKININNMYNIQIGENITMSIKKTSDSIAIIFFTCNIENDKVNTPEGLSVHDNTNNKYLNKFTKQYFTLCWTDNYTIRYNNEIILEMVSKHGWDLNIPVNREIIIIQIIYYFK